MDIPSCPADSEDKGWLPSVIRTRGLRACTDLIFNIAFLGFSLQRCWDSVWALFKPATRSPA